MNYLITVKNLDDIQYIVANDDELIDVIDILKTKVGLENKDIVSTVSALPVKVSAVGTVCMAETFINENKVR